MIGSSARLELGIHTFNCSMSVVTAANTCGILLAMLTNDTCGHSDFVPLMMPGYIFKLLQASL